MYFVAINFSQLLNTLTGKKILGARVCRTLTSEFATVPVSNLIKKGTVPLLNVQPSRKTSFFNRLTQQQLWKGVTSVSNAGKKKGRGKLADRRGARNLNAGKIIGEGKIRVLWPGLNQSILKDTGITKIEKFPDSEKEEPVQITPNFRLRKRRGVHPLERGWSGKQAKGKRIGPPDPVQDETFENFETVVLDLKLKSHLTSVLGRKRFYFSIVATGNGNGLIGVGLAKALSSKSALKLARKRAARRLITIDLIDKHTVNHDFFSEYGRTKITVLKKPEGHGLVCHRIITALCKLIGIENLYAKIKGPSNPKAIIKSFIVGLIRQKTFQEIADEKKLHLVEFRKETFDFPNVLASPEKCLTQAEARKANRLFEEYIMGNRLLLQQDSKIPFYQKSPGWQTHLKKHLFHRNHYQVRVDLFVKYGACESYLTKVYPECISSGSIMKKEEQEQ